MEKVFEIWPNATELAREIGENPITVRSWRTRGSIPSDVDTRLIEAAQRRGAVLTLQELADARSLRRERRLRRRGA